MVSVSEIVKERGTGEAADQVMLPLWLAVIEQDPAETSVSVVPETEQMLLLLEAKETVRPEVAVAERVTVPVPKVRGESAPKVML